MAAFTGAAFFTGALTASLDSLEAFLLAASKEAFLAYFFLNSVKNRLYSYNLALEDSQVDFLAFLAITLDLILSAVTNL